jgi:hypothetical protein
VTGCCARFPARVVQPERTAVLVIRVWLEAREHRQLRARITRVLDVSTSDAVDTVATSEEEIVRAVRTWLRMISGAP